MSKLDVFCTIMVLHLYIQQRQAVTDMSRGHCRPTFQQLVAILTEIEVEFRRECHRQRPCGSVANSPTPTKGRSIGPGGIPLPNGGHKPPSRFGSITDPNAGSFSAAASSTMLHAGQNELSAKAGAGPSRLSS